MEGPFPDSCLPQDNCISHDMMTTLTPHAIDSTWYRQEASPPVSPCSISPLPSTMAFDEQGVDERMPWPGWLSDFSLPPLFNTPPCSPILSNSNTTTATSPYRTSPSTQIPPSPPDSRRSRSRKTRTNRRREPSAEMIARAKVAHTTVERRYRDNLNLRLNQLRQTLAAADGFGERTEPAFVATQWDCRSRKRKSDVLLDAINYIEEAEVEVRHLRAEISALKLSTTVLGSANGHLGADVEFLDA